MRILLNKLCWFSVLFIMFFACLHYILCMRKSYFRNSLANCSCLRCKKDPSSDHAGKCPSEDRNRNCRRSCSIPTRKWDREWPNHYLRMQKAREHQQPLYMCFVDFDEGTWLDLPWQALGDYDRHGFFFAGWCCHQRWWGLKWTNAQQIDGHDIPVSSALDWLAGQTVQDTARYRSKQRI